jgi:hypothetical protein
LYEKHHDRVQFLSIYISEAHPKDGWWFGSGLPKMLLKLGKFNAATDIYTHKTIEERRAVAGRCEKALQYGIDTYVDEMDDAVNEAYAALPTRLYLVGLDGKVVYHGGLGPYGFSPKALGDAIEQYLGQMADVA